VKCSVSAGSRSTMPDAEESMTRPRTATKTYDLVPSGQTFEAYSAIRLDDNVIEAFYFKPSLSCFLVCSWSPIRLAVSVGGMN
jgi:hypothetical protein